MKAHEIAPTQFSWRKYPEQVDMDLVRRNLSHAAGPKYGSLLDGSRRTGWSMSPRGLQWAKKHVENFGDFRSAIGRRGTTEGSVDEASKRRDRARITGTNSWNRWKQGSTQLTKKDGQEIFKIDSYSVGGLRNKKINRLLLRFDNDPEMLEFLYRMAQIMTQEEAEKQ